MKLALLGSDDEAIALVRAALDSGRHTLVWASEFGDAADMTNRLPEAMGRPSGEWESLAGGVADLVIVSATGDLARRAEQLRYLVQAGVAVGVTNCVALGPIVCYELDMNRVETESPLVPVLAARLHPAIAELANSAGAIDQMTCERGIADTRAASVTQALARDVDVVRAIAGDVTRISAVGVPQGVAAPDRDFSALNVYLTTQSGPTARWAIDRLLAPGDGRITIDGQRGRAVLAMTGDRWSLTVSQRDDSPEGPESKSPATEAFEPWPSAAASLANLEAAAAGRPITPSWLDAARAADIADMLEVSLRRSRTIDIYNETYNEQGTFKGMMGIAGCGLLLVALFTLLVAALGQKTAKFFELEWLATAFGYLHYALLAVLLAFLALQLLRFAVPGTPVAKRDE